MEACVRLYNVGWCQICSGLQTDGEGRASVGVIRWLYSSQYSMEGGQMAMLVSLLHGGVVRCGNQKVMATHDSLLPCGTCPCVEGCHYREYNT